MTEEYIDIATLKTRGWTRGRIERLLGRPDSWESVNHWANFRGKAVYDLDRVRAVEETGAHIAKLVRTGGQSSRMRHIICEIEESTMVSSWTWLFFLTRTADGHYSMSIKHGVGDLPGAFPPKARRRLKSGAAVYRALKAMMAELDYDDGLIDKHIDNTSGALVVFGANVSASFRAAAKADGKQFGG